MVGHSPVFQVLLQIEVRMSIMASPPAWTNSAGMLSTPANLPIFRSSCVCLTMVLVRPNMAAGSHLLFPRPLVGDVPLVA